MLEPLLDRIIVEQVKKEDRTESGIILPDTAQDTGAPQSATKKHLTTTFCWGAPCTAPPYYL